jgi:hypothetical protein
MNPLSALLFWFADHPALFTALAIPLLLGIAIGALYVIEAATAPEEERP